MQAAEQMDRMLELVGSIYETALNPAAMPRALGKLAHALDANVAQLCSSDPASGSVLASVVSADASRQAHDAYMSYYGAIDPRRRRAESVACGTVVRCHEHFDERYVAGSEFYQDFYLPIGQRWNMGIRFDNGDGTCTSIGVSRPVGAREFEDEAAREFMRIIPHLQKASMLQKRLASQVATGLDAQGLLAALPIGGALLDARGGVMQANVAASEALADLSLRYAGNLLCFNDPERQLTWIRTIECVSNERLPKTLTLASKSGGPWRLHLIPLQLVAKAADATDSHLLLAAFERAQLGIEQRLDTLRTRFGLTKVQTEVLARLLRGASVKQIAQQRDASVNTIRTHVKSIFEKTGCRSQRELIVRLHDA